MLEIALVTKNDFHNYLLHYLFFLQFGPSNKEITVIYLVFRDNLLNYVKNYSLSDFKRMEGCFHSQD